MPGEASSIFLSKSRVGPVELATIAFGQRFKITPIQLVSAVSAIANKGIRVKPRLVKESIDSETHNITYYPVEEMGRVISEKTAKDVLSMMETVVSEGTGKGAKVEGVRVGGKTGTSEDGVNTGKYIASFLGIAPIDDPEIILLVTLYNPTGEGGHQGGGIAAPLAGEILKDVLSYLELQNKEEKEQVEMIDVRGKTIKEAKKELKALELSIDNQNNYSDDSVVLEQLPRPRNYDKQRK